MILQSGGRKTTVLENQKRFNEKKFLKSENSKQNKLNRGHTHEGEVYVVCDWNDICKW